MRIRTRLAFVCLLAAGTFFVSQTTQVVLADGCEAPGLIGFGASQQAAMSACYSHGQSACSGLCNTGCTTENWTVAVCELVDDECTNDCTATGYCKCGTVG